MGERRCIDPGVAVATLLGRAINHRMKSDRFIRLVYGGLLIIGVLLLAQAMTTMGASLRHSELQPRQPPTQPRGRRQRDG
jgi:H+/Cl- antiporter ClcA